MPDVTASRTLVKSAPELWSECSDAESLARHLNPFGEIRITRLEPETAVAWEGEHVSGTVRLQPSGWGTRVVLTATPAPTATATPAPAPAATPAPAPAATPAPAPQEPVEKPARAIAAQPAVVVTEPPEPVAMAEPPAPVECQPSVAPAPARAPAPAHAPGPRSGFFARLFGRWQRWVAPVEQEVGPVAERGAAPAEVVPEPAEPVAAVSEPAEPEVAADEPSPEPTPPGPDPQVALLAALDSLGQAHHRPYSRA